MPSPPYQPFADTSVYFDLGATRVRLPSATVISSSDSWEQSTLPIEQGATISNHRKRQPTDLTIEGVVTGQLNFAGPVGASALSSPDDIRKRIYELADNGTVFTVRWCSRRWANMAIVSISDDAPAGELREDMWRFSLGLRTTRIASSTTTPASAIDSSISDLTAGGSDAGPQAGTTVGPELSSSVTGVLGGPV
jgi:hypothetical protein